MEKIRPDALDFWLMYDKMHKPSVLARVVDGTGMGFIGGTVGGSVYHYIKSSSKQQPLVSRMKLACAKAPRVGGFCALFCTVNTLIGKSVDSVNVNGSNLRTMLIADAASGALMWAPKGIRSASLAAFLMSASTVFLHLAGAWLDTFDESLSIPRTNAYSYHHHHHHQRKLI